MEPAPSVSLTIAFEFDSAQLSKDSAEQLKELASALTSEELNTLDFLIEGHTDNIPYSGRGSLKGNWDLSTKRATSIVNTLLKNTEILPQNLTAAGRGEYLPIATNSTREGRATNRRIEVILSPKLDEITQIINTLD